MIDAQSAALDIDPRLHAGGASVRVADRRERLS